MITTATTTTTTTTHRQQQRQRHRYAERGGIQTCLPPDPPLPLRRSRSFQPHPFVASKPRRQQPASRPVKVAGTTFYTGLLRLFVAHTVHKRLIIFCFVFWGSELSAKAEAQNKTVHPKHFHGGLTHQNWKRTHCMRLQTSGLSHQ